MRRGHDGDHVAELRRVEGPDRRARPGVRAENGTIATPMPAAASCAAVRGLPVRSTGWGSTTPRSAASWSTHAANPLSGL